VVARPTGISVLAVAAAAVAVLALIGAIGWWGASDTLLFAPRIAGVAKLVALVLVVVAGFDLALAYGLWQLRPWAWPLGIVLEIVVLVLIVVQLGHGSLVGHLISGVVAVITLWYLFTPRARAALGA